MGSPLKSITEVFSETWDLYKQRAVPILLVILLTSFLVIVLLCIFGIMMALGLGGLDALTGHVQKGACSPLFIITALFGLLVVCILIFWSQAAAIAITVDTDSGIMKALKDGWKYLIPLGWISTLYMGIVLTGVVFFLIPGVILALSMSFCFYALIDDDLHGMDALVASRQYIRGHWWNTLGKFLPVWLISVAVGLVPYVGQLLSFMVSPFLLLYMLVVYRDLKEAAAEVNLHSAPRRLWTFMAALGILLPLLGLVGALVTLGPQLPDLIQQLQQKKSQGGLDEPTRTVSDRTVTLHVPYTLLHIEGRDTLRVCYHEANQQQGSGLAKVQLVPLNSGVE